MLTVTQWRGMQNRVVDGPSILITASNEARASYARQHAIIRLILPAKATSGYRKT